MELVHSTVAMIQRGYLGWATVFAALTALELLAPKGRQPLGARLFGLAYWAALVPASAVMLQLWTLMWDRVGVPPLLTVPLFAPLSQLGVLGAALGVIAGATVHDFFFYWFHRAQHRWFWRFHAVHHSIENLSAVNSYHHLSEAVLPLVLLTLPASLIAVDTGPALPFVGLGLWLHIVYIHSPTSVHLGPLRVFFADNRFHRIHHSLEERHFDRNFGAFTTLWDRVFGTAHFPAADEWPAVGLAEVREPKSLSEWLDLPARYRAASVAVEAVDEVRGGPPPHLAAAVQGAD